MTEVNYKAVGKVASGFSKPYVALYNVNAGVVSYSQGQIFARGVSVDLSPESSDSNIFWADNQQAESVPSYMTGGTVSITIDGLLTKAKKLVYGVPDADAEGWVAYGDSMNVPYVGIGFIVRYVSGGVDSYAPTILTKTKFQMPTGSFSTGTESIEWQTTALTANLFRDDSSNHNWKYEGIGYATEAEAEEAIKKFFNITD